ISAGSGPDGWLVCLAGSLRPKEWWGAGPVVPCLTHGSSEQHQISDFAGDRSSDPMQANETQPTTVAVTYGGGRSLVNAVLSVPHMLRSQRGSCIRTTLSPHPSLSCGNA
ncbi:hypothetical protein PspLS_04973, partial [Pyricularia sp. CBS 133598]